MSLQTEYGDGKAKQGQIGGTGKPRITKKALGKKFDNYTDNMSTGNTVKHYAGWVLQNGSWLADATGIGLPVGIGARLAGAKLLADAEVDTKRDIAVKEGYDPDKEAPGKLKATTKHFIPGGTLLG
jgi:hypothetical protein